ncbi:MAG TPA: HD domain-containing protein, partial [Gemmatimonadales bacterium]|nr:HD domain-containing protein [Gemmatimonadales bacterium]
MTRGVPEFEIIRDPLWDNIRLDRPTMAVVDTPALQRLRYVRQLGHAFLVYPGATHTRFEHALGAYHLARRAVQSLAERGELARVPEEDRTAVLLAALLHDIGHYPFSHGLEEAGFPHHEGLGVARLEGEELAARLAGWGIPGLTARIGGLITGEPHPLSGLISGSLDLDKIDYLSRDARMCGVPYGQVDVDRLLASLTLVDTERGVEVGVHEKGVSALESLLFAKYQMYRNVYWHHAVRSATCMFKRAVRGAVAAGAVTPGWVAGATDGALVERLLAADPGG